MNNRIITLATSGIAVAFAFSVWLNRPGLLLCSLGFALDLAGVDLRWR